MGKIRYVNRDYLCQYDLSFDFFHELGIKIKDVTPLRKIFVLNTSEGTKILKKINYDISKLNIINDSLKYIYKKYKNIIVFNEFNDGNCYKKWGKGIYVLMDRIEGHECSFSNPLEIKLCAKNVALLHKASNGIKQYLEEKYNMPIMDITLKQKFKEAKEDLIYFKSIVEKYENKNEFDRIFIENVDKYCEEIKLVEREINEEEYENLRNDEGKICICHNDLAYHNFLIEGEKINIIDFDYMTIDLRVVDLADFILKAVKNAAFDIKKMETVLESYEEEIKLSVAEKKLIKLILKFPRDFYSISNDYYRKKKSWDYEVYLSRLKGKLDNEIFRYELIQNYKF